MPARHSRRHTYDGAAGTAEDQQAPAAEAPAEAAAAKPKKKKGGKAAVDFDALLTDVASSRPGAAWRQHLINLSAWCTSKLLRQRKLLLPAQCHKPSHPAMPVRSRMQTP